MYLPRKVEQVVKQALSQFPAVLITGPRQSGKTTFVQQAFGQERHYRTLDDPLHREFVRQDPNGFFDALDDKPITLDEVQQVPEIFSHLKLRIDRQRQMYGRWLLTGSQQFQLMRHVSESLAGRIAVLDLLPFGQTEIQEEIERTLAQAIWNGWYPEPCLQPEKRKLWVRSYFQTYVERDIRQLQNVKDLETFNTFMSLLATHHGQLLNQSKLARQCGVSVPTIKSWIGILKASYLILLVEPYFENFGKRITKSPKLFFLDSAIVTDITRQPDDRSSLQGMMSGALFEGLVVSEATKTFAQLGLRSELYHWRSHGGLEVDLLVRLGPQLLPVEIKLTRTPKPRHLEPINQFRTLADKQATSMGLLVCNIDQTIPMPNGNLAIPWNDFSSWLVEHL